jgi:hypothetical protein
VLEFLIFVNLGGVAVLGACHSEDHITRWDEPRERGLPKISFGLSSDDCKIEPDPNDSRTTGGMVVDTYNAQGQRIGGGAGPASQGLTVKITADTAYGWVHVGGHNKRINLD